MTRSTRLDGDATFVRGGGEAGAIIRSIDWRETALGPAARWPQSLRTALSICLRSRFPIALYWGPSFVMLYNDALLPMVGANKHPWAMGRPAFEVLPEIRHLIEPLFAQVIATGEAIWQEDLMLPLDRGGGQEEGYFTFTYSPIEDETGGVGGVFCAVLETTAKVLAERRNALAFEAERRRAEALAKLDHAKTAFFSNVSHEFRTPLTLMLAPIQDMLAQPSGSAIDRASVELLERNALRLLKLVNTLLEFSRIEAGRADAVYRPVELAALTADLASSFRSVVERAGLTFAVDCAPLGQPVFVDQAMWEKIVLNLLSNAFKFTFAGSIAVRLASVDGAAQLEVADTGTGIAEADLPRIFERFHRIEGARSRSHEGSGIGLALIHELVQLHGGSVTVTSTPDVGTRFVVRIPFGSAHLPPARLEAAPALVSTAITPAAFLGEIERWNTPAVPVDASNRERIVVADDNADMREHLARLLGERWRVEAVADGALALAAIRREPPVLVVTDVMMPNLDGFELVEAMRADEALRGIPAIILSARAGVEETARGLGAGANDYIAKPFSARELLVRVTATIEIGRASRDLRAQRDNFYRHFTQSPFPVAVLRGPDHVVELANEAILAVWGRTAACFGQPLGELLPELRTQPFLGYLDEVYRTGTSYVGRSERTSLPSGPGGELTTRFFNFVYAALRDPGGAITGVLVSAFDVTEVLHAQRLAEEAAAERQSVLEFQERFVAILGHDLRSPLAAIDMALELLRQRGGDAQSGKLIGRAEASSRRMSRMIEQILDLSRIRIAGGLTIDAQPMDLGVMLGAIVDEIRVAHPDHTILIACPPITGNWDRDRLEQLFSNLIGNAIHHGARTSPITVRGASFEDHVEVRVHNAGEPIPEALRPMLFEAFRRGERDSRSPGTAGLGLGLYITHQIVTAHGGTIDVESSAATGTTFCVTLPRQR